MRAINVRIVMFKESTDQNYWFLKENTGYFKTQESRNLFRQGVTYVQIQKLGKNMINYNTLTYNTIT